MTGESPPQAGQDRWSRASLVLVVAALALSLLLVALAYRNSAMASQDEEAEVLRSLRYASGDFKPTFVTWGALSSYVLFGLFGASYAAGRVLGIFAGTDDYLRLYLVDPRFFFLVGRLLYAVLGGVLLLVVRRFAARRWGSAAGFIAAAALAFLPLLVTFSTTVKADGMATLLGVLALAAATGESGSGMRRAVLAGALWGFAIGAKYHLAFLAPGLLVALWTAGPEGRGARILAAGAVAAAAFVAANPYTVIDPGAWFLGDYGLFRMFGHYDPRKTGGYARADLPGFFAAGTGGFLPAALLLAALPAALLRGDRVERVLGTASASFLLIVALQGYAEPHHFLPVLPLLALLLAAGVRRLADRFPARPWIPAAVACAVAVLPAARILPTVRNASLPNTVAEAKAWIEGNLPSGTRVLVDWAYVPALHPSVETLRAELEDGKPDSAPRVAYLRRMIRLDLRPAYRLGVLAVRLRASQDPGEAAHFDLARYRREGFRYAIISDAWYGRFFREPFLPEDDPVRAFYVALLRSRIEPMTFAPEEGKRTGPAIRVVDLRE